MGLSEWRLRERELTVIESLAVEPQQVPPVAVAPAATPVPDKYFQDLSPRVEPGVAGLGDWPELQAAVMTCTGCARHSTRLQAVPGAGSNTADCLFVAEAPSAEDDATGQPFSDASGLLFDNMLAAMGLNRSSIYLTQVTKCAIPDEHPPESTEIVACSRYLEAQIKLLQPKLIVALGLTAGRYLLNIKTDVSLGSLRGEARSHAPSGVPVIVTYHPRYLLKRPSAKAAAWQDLQQVMPYLNGTCQ